MVEGSEGDIQSFKEGVGLGHGELGTEAEAGKPTVAAGGGRLTGEDGAMSSRLIGCDWTAVSHCKVTWVF